MNYYFIAVFFVVLIVSAIVIAKNKNPYRTALISSGSGLLCIILVNVTSVFTGVSLAYNFYTAACAAFLGTPGVILMLLLR
jgi:hypothetical protein